MGRSKIVIATGIYPPEIGGPATYTALMEKELPQKGIDVLVLPFRTVRHLPSIIRHFAFFWKVLVLGIKADLLYAQDPVSVGFPTMLAANILRKPFLLRVAGDWVWEQSVQRFGVKENINEFQSRKYGLKVEMLRKIQALTTRHTNLVITPSKYFRNLVAAWNPQKDNVITVYNGINFTDISQDGGSFEPKTIISAGRMLPWKGFDTLIKIIRQLAGWRLYIAGDGPEKENLENLIRDSGVGNRVVLLGSIQIGR